MDERAKQIARNESLFREVNERIEELAETMYKSAHGGFLCECGDVDCSETLSLMLDVYERVRDDPHRFVIKRGHQIAEFEKVVEETDEYAVVEKEGDAAEVAERLDPRS